MRNLSTALQKQVHQPAIKTATAREFNGGWNVIDHELNLSTSYAVVMDNVSRDEDGASVYDGAHSS